MRELQPSVYTSFNFTIRRTTLNEAFPKIPTNYINQVVTEQQTLYQAYKTVDAATRNLEENDNRAFTPLKRPRKSNSRSITDPQLQLELTAARERRQKEEGEILLAPFSIVLALSIQ